MSRRPGRGSVRRSRADGHDRSVPLRRALRRLARGGVGRLLVGPAAAGLLVGARLLLLDVLDVLLLRRRALLLVRVDAPAGAHLAPARGRAGPHGLVLGRVARLLLGLALIVVRHAWLLSSLGWDCPERRR